MSNRTHPVLKTALLLAVLSIRLMEADAGETNQTAEIKALSLTADADTAFAAFNKAFYVVENGKGYYRELETGGRNHFWTQAEEIEMILDTWERSRSPTCAALINETISGFVDHFGTDWKSNPYNDDVMWMTIACARAFLDTDNATCKNLAKANFNETFARSWSTNLGGGLWWSTTNASKNACVNGPAAIAACYLYEICRDATYLEKAKAIYAWERKNLFEESTGAVRDNMRANGRIAGRPLTYNEGTFIGAANLLGKLTGDKTYLADAEKAADYTRDRLCVEGILPAYGGGDAAGFNGIFIRWLARFATDNHLLPKYRRWMIQNADAAWTHRRADNLSWNKWQTQTPDGTLRAWACADTVVIMQIVLAENR